MPSESKAVVVIDVRVRDKKAMRALAVVSEVMQSIAEDFEYRDDVKRAVRAFNYLQNNLIFSTDIEPQQKEPQ